MNQKKYIFIFWCLIISVCKLFANDESVIITGKFLDTKFPSVSLLYYDVIGQQLKYFYTAKVDTITGNFKMNFKISAPIFCKFFEDFFYISPGDSVNLSLTTDTSVRKGYALSIEGRNAGHYLFYSYLTEHSKLNINAIIKNYTGNWNLFQKKCTQKYKEDIATENSFVKKYSVQNDFYKYWKQEIYCNYLVNLLQPLYLKENYSVSLINNYLNVLKVDSLFKVDELYLHQPFRQFCGDYLKFIIAKKNESFSTYEELEKTCQFVLTHYSGRIQEYFLCFIYNQAILLKESTTANLAKRISELSLNSFEDKEIKNHIKLTYLTFSNIAKILPDSIMEEKLYNLAGEKVKLKEVLESLKGKYILVDNWATWCMPCIDEINKAETLINIDDFKKNNLEILYLSQDENFIEWNGFAKKRNSSMKNSFIFVRTPNSFINFFIINRIPRYILLGKEGELIDYDAPRPSDFYSILRIIKNNGTKL